MRVRTEPTKTARRSLRKRFLKNIARYHSEMCRDEAELNKPLRILPTSAPRSPTLFHRLFSKDLRGVSLATAHPILRESAS